MERTFLDLRKRGHEDRRPERWTRAYSSTSECLTLFCINAKSLRGFKAEMEMIRMQFLKNSLLAGEEFKTQEEAGDLLGTSAAMQVRIDGDLDQLVKGSGARC